MPNKIKSFKDFLESTQFKKRTNNKIFTEDELIEIEKLYNYILVNEGGLVSKIGNYNTFISLINYEIYDLINRFKFLKKNRNKNTKETFICRYGETEGLNRWTQYTNKHKVKNTFEYKSKKFGWTKEEFDEYNKSRAVTMENCIKRHGHIKGMEIWNHYVDRQRYTNSLEYFEEIYESFGYDEWMKYNNKKGNSKKIECIMEKYDVSHNQALIILSDRQSKSHTSKSEMCFVENLELELDEKIKYTAKTKQFSLWCNYTDSVRFYDITCTKRKKIIEFNGDYWHCNPLLYESNFYHKHLKKTASEVWKQDYLKIKTAIDNGFEVKIVWWSDFEKDPEKVLKECKEWMN